jgi:thiol:disulfide interchange protein DsbA
MTAPRTLRAGLLGGLLAAALALTACGGKPETAAPASPAATATAAETPAAPAAPELATPAPAADPAAAPVPTESAGEPPAGNSLGKDIVVADAAPAPANWKFSEGPHYTRLTAAQGTSSPAGTIEVTEIFWYGCPHCYDLEPQLKDWATRQQADVRVVKVPVMWQEPHEIHARVFYTAEALGKLDQIGPEVFRAFHLQGKQLLEVNEIRAFFGQFGVSAEQFDSTWNSFGVDQSLKRAKDIMNRYKVRSVPLLVVNGKYVTNGPEIRSHKEQLELVDELIARERAGS